MTLLSRRDIDFLLYDWLGVETLLERTRFADHSRDTFDAVLDVSAQVAARHFANHNRANDLNEPRFVDGRVELVPEIRSALKVMADTGLFAGDLDYDLGGMQLPKVVANASMTWFEAANVATTAYAFLTVAATHLLVRFGDDQQRETYARPMAEGRWFGTMCLSEPDAGSSLADVTTRATPQPDGAHRLFGTKMWISAGDHELAENIVHLVLARLDESPPGTKGLSLFIVPKYLPGGDGGFERNDVTLVGLNHKMGFRGTTNTVLSFGDGDAQPGGTPGAVGFLVGQPGNGLAQMFHMMNEARIGVGRMAVALGCTGYLKSLRYARERRQGRTVADRDPTKPQVPIIEHPDVRRMLLAQKAYAEGALALILYCSLLLDEEQTAPDDRTRLEARQLLDVLTPIAKSWPSQWCLAANDLAIQVLGGAGYTRDHDLEQHYRDNRLNSIHEGTHGIQALDLLGRKVELGNGAAFAALVGRIRATAEAALAAGGPAAELAGPLSAAVDDLERTTAAAAAAPDRAAVLANATPYLEAAGHVVLAWIWLDLHLVANANDAFAEGKRCAARFFYRYELPKVRPLLALVAQSDRTTLECEPSWL